MDIKRLAKAAKLPKYMHDTEGGRDALAEFAGLAGAIEREACANTLNLTRSDALLMAGEMTAQEWRTVAAVLKALQSRMRSNALGEGRERGILRGVPLDGWVGRHRAASTDF